MLAQGDGRISQGVYVRQGINYSHGLCLRRRYDIFNTIWKYILKQFVGLISRELIPHVKSIVGVDITPAVVDVYNQRVTNQGVPPEKMRAIAVELKGQEGELDGLKFDVIVVCDRHVSIFMSNFIFCVLVFHVLSSLRVHRRHYKDARVLS